MRVHAFLPLILATLCSSSFAVGAYFPAQPTIDSPAADADNIELNPELSGSALAEIDSSGNMGSSGNIVFTSAEWRVFEPDNRNVVYGGMRGDDTVSLNNIPESIFLYTIPAGLSIGDTIASQLSISSRGSAQLQTESGTVITEVTALPGPLTELRPTGTKSIIVRAFEKGDAGTFGVLIQWKFTQMVSSEELITQALFLENGATYMFLLPKDMNDTVYSSTDSLFYVSTAGSSYSDSLAGWKAFLLSEDSEITDFALAFSADESGVVQPGSSPNGSPGPSTHEDLVSYQDVDVTSPEALLDLSPGTEYAMQVQYTASENSNERFSNWSAVRQFTTKLSTDYEASVTSDEQVVATVPSEFFITVTNKGEDTGRPRVEVRLPFNALEVVSGSFNEHYLPFTEAENQNCDDFTDPNSNQTSLYCEFDSVSSEANLVSFTTTFYENGPNSIEYRVCETILNRCDGIEYNTLSLSVAAAPEVDNPQPGSGDEESNESTAGDPDFGAPSSSGSISWLPLLGLALLRRRRYTSHRH